MSLNLLFSARNFKQGSEEEFVNSMNPIKIDLTPFDSKEKIEILYEYFHYDHKKFIYNEGEDLEYKLIEEENLCEIGECKNNLQEKLDENCYKMNPIDEESESGWASIAYNKDELLKLKNENLIQRANIERIENNERIIQNSINYQNISNPRKKEKNPTKTRYFDSIIGTENLENKISIFSSINQNKFPWDFSSKENKKSKHILKLKQKPDPQLFTLDLISLTHKPLNDKNKSLLNKYFKSSDPLIKDCSEKCKFKDENNICCKCSEINNFMKEGSSISCIRCNGFHQTHLCPAPQKSAKCIRCRHIGHYAEDCLRNPVPIRSDILKRNKCFFCGELGHFICPMKIEFIFMDDYNEELVEIEESNKSEMTEEVESSTHKFSISELSLHYAQTDKNFNVQISCPKCAGCHQLKECGKAVSPHKNDKSRKVLTNSLFVVGASKLSQDKNFMDDSFSD
jgi:hypothetical protein